MEGDWCLPALEVCNDICGGGLWRRRVFTSLFFSLLFSLSLFSLFSLFSPFSSLSLSLFLIIIITNHYWIALSLLPSLYLLLPSLYLLLLSLLPSPLLLLHSLLLHHHPVQFLCHPPHPFFLFLPLILQMNRPHQTPQPSYVSYLHLLLLIHLHPQQALEKQHVTLLWRLLRPHPQMPLFMHLPLSVRIRLKRTHKHTLENGGLGGGAVAEVGETSLSSLSSICMTKRKQYRL